MMVAVKRRAFNLDRAIFIVSFLVDLGLVAYTVRGVRSHSFSDMNRPLLFLATPLVVGALFLFSGIRSLIQTQQNFREGVQDIEEEEAGASLRYEVTMLIYGSVLLFVGFGGALVCINLVVRR
jgi:hypothetical protein